MMKTKKFLSERHWLNPKGHQDTGAVTAECELDIHPKGRFYPYAELSIWDCNKKISLNLSWGSKTEFKQRINKVRKLIVVLERLVSAMEACEIYSDDIKASLKETEEKT